MDAREEEEKEKKDALCSANITKAAARKQIRTRQGNRVLW